MERPRDCKLTEHDAEMLECWHAWRSRACFKGSFCSQNSPLDRYQLFLTGRRTQRHLIENVGYSRNYVEVDEKLSIDGADMILYLCLH